MVMDKRRDYHKEFLHLCDEISSIFRLDRYSEGLVPNGKVIQADSFSSVWDVLDKIEDSEFIDIGSGKGKVILYNLIIDSPYKDYIGVEIDKELKELQGSHHDK